MSHCTFVTPGLFDRLSCSDCRHRSVTKQSLYSIEEVVITKSDETVVFATQCTQAAEACKATSRRYRRAAYVTELLAITLANCCGFITMELMWWGVAMGMVSAMLSIMGRVFKWEPLQEKYAGLARKFIVLARDVAPDKQHRYERLKLFMESTVLEMDLL